MKKLLSIGLGVMLFMSSIGISSANESINISRVSGYDRYETAVNANKKFMDHANGNLAVISSGSDFKTALYASHMASALKVPYFVNPKHGVRTDILNEMQRLNVSRVYVVGDYKVLDRSVDNTLKSKGMKLQRFYERYEALENGAYYKSTLSEQVDMAIINTFFPDDLIRGVFSNAIAINDNKFPDLLSSIPLTSELASKCFKYIVNPEELYVGMNIDEGANHYMNIGGHNSVSAKYNIGEYINDDFIKSDKNRIYGQNRYETAVEIAKGYKTYLNKDIKTIVLVNGEDYPDALSSSLVATQNNGAVLLTQSNKLNKDTAKYIKDSGIKNIIIVGGEKSVSKGVENELRNLYLK